MNEKDKELKLTTLEFDLLLLFVQNRNKCFTREEILDSVWGNDYFGTDRVVDDLVRRLRKKMPNLMFMLFMVMGIAYHENSKNETKSSVNCTYRSCLRNFVYLLGVILPKC